MASAPDIALCCRWNDCLMDKLDEFWPQRRVGVVVLAERDRDGHDRRRLAAAGYCCVR